MNEVTTILEQLRQFSVQHAPGGVPTGALPVALILLTIGIGLAVVGAKFARFGLTTAFVLAGGLLGDRFAQAFEYPRPVCMAIGAGLIGLIGFQTFRVWVGVAVAAVLCLLVLAGFGAKRVMPHFSEYAQTSPLELQLSAPAGQPEFSIPNREEQSAYLNRDPGEWFSGFWRFLTERDSNLARNTQALAILTALGGLCLGLMAVRPSLIISTSLIGTTMFAAGVFTLLSSSVPSTYAKIEANPRLIGLGLAAFLGTSLLLQTMLMRKSTIATKSAKD